MTGINAAQLRKWVLVGLGVGTLVLLLSGVLLTGDWGGLLLNVGAEFGGALATYVLLELFIGRRERHEAEEKELEAKKAGLIAQMGSQVQDVAIAAAEELRRHGWLFDSSLRGANLRMAKLPGVDLYRAKLQEVDLMMANLRGAWLAGADLQGATLSGVDLRGASLEVVDLQGASLFRANLQGATLAWAKLQGAILWEADLREANLEGASFSSGTILPDRTNWTQGVDMARFTDPQHPDFWSPGA